MKIKQVNDLVHALQRAKGDKEHPCGKAIFLVGAGCSKSAGIPLGDEIVNERVKDLVVKYSNEKYAPGSSEEALEWLKTEGHIPGNIGSEMLYGHLFETHYPGPTEQQRIIFQAIERCDGKINWAHLCLGELVRQGYIHTVLTTNFDQLVLEGIIRTGILPVVADGVESLTRVSSMPRHPQVVHLHGSMHTYNPLNSASSVNGIHHDLRVGGVLYPLLCHSDVLVVIGYAGGEEGVMSLLVEAANHLQDKVIYWVQHSANPNDLSKKAKELLDCTENKFLIIGQDADAFFEELMKGLELGIPKWMKDPIASLREHAERITLSSNRDIKDEVVHYRKRLLGYRDAESAHERALREIRELRLEGHHKKALNRAKEHFDESIDPGVWFMCGDSAYKLWCSDANTSWLELSITSYQTALGFIQKNNDPNFWAETQNNLGNALRVLGKSERDRSKLGEAVAAYEETLKVYNRDDTPLDWARAQDNLGIALYSLSKEMGNDEKILKRALVAHKKALEVYSRDDTPLDWAMSQNNLGQVLRKLGQFKGDVALLKQAVTVHEEALEVCDRDHTPLVWAMTQDNLGMALHRLGYCEENEQRLKQAVTAYKKALTVCEREWLQKTLDWARIQSGLGNVLRELGDLTNEEVWFNQAESAYKEALDVYTDRYMPDRYRVVTGSLKRVKDSLMKLAIEKSTVTKGVTH